MRSKSSVCSMTDAYRPTQSTERLSFATKQFELEDKVTIGAALPLEAARPASRFNHEACSADPYCTSLPNLSKIGQCVAEFFIIQEMFPAYFMEDILAISCRN